MYGIEEILQGFASNVITIILLAAAIGLAIMYLVSKLTGSDRVGGIAAGGILLFCFYWLTKEGHLIEYLSKVD